MRNLLIWIFLLTAVIVLSESATETIPSLTSEGTPLLQVHFIDVGQGDCTLVISPEGSTMLIDAGLNKEFETVMKYLKTLGISNIDILIGTHPDLDHIGSLDEIIDSFKRFFRIYIPLYAKDTKAFRYVVEAILNNDLQITPALGGYYIPFGSLVTLQIVAPNSLEYDNANDYSVVVLLRYDKIAFLFPGDAEVTSEREMLQKGYDLDVTVLKLGHHGSKSSSSMEFLKAISPEWAVASVGKGNRFGHPAVETIEKLQELNIKLLRTDELGNIVMLSDGATITIITGELENVIHEISSISFSATAPPSETAGVH
ncbi:ComEC/Rec2 family competence protein [Kosmotoga pacifica]|uniref:ComEC/Rec2 family competence protein n=1 Tax=Kosmotoga pacifica TaxID=1330330 RepID=UPI00069A96BB|nr:ComEC/Rec2 family competence protein [Kosmotoga pacifica]